MTTLQVGDTFQQAWRDCTNPMWFEVLSIDRPNNSLRVECHDISGYTHEEDWDDLDTTEIAFEIGEYKFLNK